jgi:ribosomal-protein-alanine N-acetyltransferase
MPRHAQDAPERAPALRGEGVLIRFLSDADATALCEFRARNRDFFAPYDPAATDADFTMEATRRRIAAQVSDREEDRAYAFGIFRPADGALVGHVALSAVFRRAWQNANLGYSVGRADNGRGYATEAVRLALSFAFEHAGLHRVQAAVLTDNDRSKRVLDRVGFRLEGLARRYLQINGDWRDHDIYAMTREDWNARR